VHLYFLIRAGFQVNRTCWLDQRRSAYVLLDQRVEVADHQFY